MLNTPDEKLRIGYILKRFPSLSQTFILNEILELEHQGVAVEILSLRRPRPEPTHSRLEALKAPVCYLEDLTEPEYTSPLEQAANWAKTRRLQHLHAHFATSAAEFAMLAAKAAEISYSFTAHARDIFHEKVDKAALAERIQHARFVVTVSDYNRHYLNNLLESRSVNGHVYRLYNGIDPDLLQPVRSGYESGLIVSIGRLVPKKGLLYLVAACAELRDRNVPFKTIIIGEGDERAALQDAIRQFSLENHVSLAGAMVQSDVIAALSRAHLFALPCIVADDGDVDGLPTVILEAMAMGVPVVSTRLVGIPEMIRHRTNGLLVEQKQTSELADALQTLLGSDELRESFKNQSLKHMDEHFNLRKNVARLSEWFAQTNV